MNIYFLNYIEKLWLTLRMGRLMVPRLMDNNPLGTQETVSLKFEENKLMTDARKTEKLHG